jgi:hypothetical protein
MQGDAHESKGKTQRAHLYQEHCSRISVTKTRCIAHKRDKHTLIKGRQRSVPEKEGVAGTSHVQFQQQLTATNDLKHTPTTSSKTIRISSAGAQPCNFRNINVATM